MKKEKEQAIKSYNFFIKDFENFYDAFKKIEKGETAEIEGEKISSYEELAELFNDYFLSIEKIRDNYCGELDTSVYRLFLGYGGPTIWLDVEVDCHTEEIASIQYYYIYFNNKIEININNKKIFTVLNRFLPLSI